MKDYQCLVPGCQWHSQAEDEAELVRRAVEHLKSVHDETEVRPRMVERIKERIHDAEPARG